MKNQVFCVFKSFDLCWDLLAEFNMVASDVPPQVISVGEVLGTLSAPVAAGH